MNEGISSNAPQGFQDTCRPEQPVANYTTGVDPYAGNIEVAVPTPINPNKIRKINIEEVNRGFIVRVGCHTFAISTKAELTTKLTEYINEPEKTEQKWHAGNLF